MNMHQDFSVQPIRPEGSQAISKFLYLNVNDII